MGILWIPPPPADHFTQQNTDKLACFGELEILAPFQVTVVETALNPNSLSRLTLEKHELMFLQYHQPVLEMLLPPAYLCRRLRPSLTSLFQIMFNNVFCGCVCRISYSCFSYTLPFHFPLAKVTDSKGRDLHSLRLSFKAALINIFILIQDAIIMHNVKGVPSGDKPRFMQ